MIDHNKSQIVARTIGSIASMSAHIVVAEYFKHLTKNADQTAEWQNKINEANQTREAAITVLANMITDLHKQPERNEPNEKENIEH